MNTQKTTGAILMILGALYLINEFTYTIHLRFDTLVINICIGIAVITIGIYIFNRYKNTMEGIQDEKENIPKSNPKS